MSTSREARSGIATIALLLPFAISPRIGCIDLSAETSASNQTFLQRQIDDVKQGTSNAISFYDIEDTDTSLAQIKGQAGIVRLIIDSCDVGPRGMAIAATLPDLQWLSLFNVRVQNSDFTSLAACPRLERIDIKCNEPWDVLSLLNNVPQVRDLSLGPRFDKSR